MREHVQQHLNYRPRMINPSSTRLHAPTYTISASFHQIRHIHHHTLTCFVFFLFTASSVCRVNQHRLLAHKDMYLTLLNFGNLDPSGYSPQGIAATRAFKQAPTERHQSILMEIPPNRSVPKAYSFLCFGVPYTSKCSEPSTGCVIHIAPLVVDKIRWASKKKRCLPRVRV